jgi:hypothetical protein
MEQSKKDNPEKLTTKGTQKEEKLYKNTTQYVWTPQALNKVVRSKAPKAPLIVKRCSDVRVFHM